jgi:diguanylate cyclase (GGDEF)-like protein/PAS domain S-box-containing protein
MSNRLRGLLSLRPVQLAAGVLAFAALCLALALNAAAARQRAAGLERELLSLQLAQLERNLESEAASLQATTRELAGSDAIAQLLVDPAATPAIKLDGSTGPGAVNELVLISGTAIRYSAATVGGRLVEHAPDETVLQFRNSIGVAGERLIAAQPVAAHAGAAAGGWLVVTRLSTELHPAPTMQSFRQTEWGSLPPDVRRDISTKNPTGFGVTTFLSGYAVLHDSSGRAAGVLRIERPRSLAAGWHWLPAVLVVALVTLLGLGAFFALQRYFRAQRSVDARYKAIIDQTNDGIVIVDAATHHVQYCNPAFLARLGYESADAAALTLTDLFADGNASAAAVLARLRNADAAMALNMQQRCKNGTFVDIEVRCNTLDVDGRELRAYVTHDVSVRRKAEQQLIENQQRLDRMAHHDQLTGLPNRHYLASFLPQAIAEARGSGAMLGVVFLDLDRFKHINDTRGHETGDKLLQEVGGRLRACVRDSDVVIRMGGDEFVVVFRNVKSYDEVTNGAARIIDTLNRPIVIDQHPLQTTGSVGVSLFPRDGADMGELLKHSDTAMYQAKDRGRNNVQIFSQVMNRKLEHRVAMEAALREALRLKQFDVHYQPFVNLLTRKIVGLEALMRWRHPVHGMIPADKFIPVAEETGLIVPMGNFVLHRTLQTMSAWRKAGVALVPVSLNVAPIQLQRGDFQATISTLLKSHGLRPDMLQLEMTERAVFDSSQDKPGESRQDTMGRLRDLGIKIAIDDFGTGYSSLSYLKNWRIDSIKIDRSFVRDLATDSSDLAIVSAIIAIARHLHIQVVAEGIEGYQQAEILRKLGCSVGQGFLFARPMPADECVKLLGNQEAPEHEEEDMLAAFASGRA